MLKPSDLRSQMLKKTECCLIYSVNRLYTTNEPLVDLMDCPHPLVDLEDRRVHNPHSIWRLRINDSSEGLHLQLLPNALKVDSLKVDLVDDRWPKFRSSL